MKLRCRIGWHRLDWTCETRKLNAIWSEERHVYACRHCTYRISLSEAFLSPRRQTDETDTDPDHLGRGHGSTDPTSDVASLPGRRGEPSTKGPA